MTLIETITPTEAAAWLNMDVRTFNNLVDELGFIKFPGTTKNKVRYSKEDIASKYLVPKDQSTKPKKKKRGTIKI